jgi:hypothetical protein
MSWIRRSRRSRRGYSTAPAGAAQRMPTSGFEVSSDGPGFRPKALAWRSFDLLAAPPARSFVRAPDQIQISLKLGDPMKLHLLVVSQIVDDLAALVQDRDHAVEFGARHVDPLSERDCACSANAARLRFLRHDWESGIVRVARLRCQARRGNHAASGSIPPIFGGWPTVTQRGSPSRLKQCNAVRKVVKNVPHP